MDITNCGPIPCFFVFFFLNDSECHKGEVGCLKVSYFYIG